DGAAAAAAARALLDEAPEESFGPHDFLVARAIIAELKARHPGRAVSQAGPEDRDLLELARTRLEVFLDGGGGTADERVAAQGSLAAVRCLLDGGDVGRRDGLRL